MLHSTLNQLYSSQTMLKILLFLLFIFIKRLNYCYAINNISQQLTDAVFVKGEDEILRCYIELAIDIKPEYKRAKDDTFRVAQKLKRIAINNHTTVEWLKNNEPLHRENGNFMQDKDKYAKIMHNVGCLDEGAYTCRYTYNATPTMHKLLTFVTEQHFNLKVDDRQLLDEPVISHPPQDQIVSKGANVTFECTHYKTKLDQSFGWFRLTTLNFTGPDVLAFINAYNMTNKTMDTSLLDKYTIKDHKLDRLKLNNVAEEHTGFYGCYAATSNRLELRLASLKLVENLIVMESRYSHGHQHFQWIYILLILIIGLVMAFFVALHFIKLSFSKREKIIIADHKKASIPVYDYPPSNGTNQFGSFFKSSCVMNPIYGLAQSLDCSDLGKYRKRLINDRELIYFEKIGEGQFGEVHRCILKTTTGPEQQVAVKMLRSPLGIENLGSERDRKDLIGEIEIMKLLIDHPYIVKMLDFVVKDGEPILLLMELVENGKLQTYLRSSRNYLKCNNETDSYITSRDLIKFSYQVAKGMEYVASKGIIHRDLASRNILVTENRVCKVADFGFARRINDECAYERTNGDILPIRWMAPEALVENKFTSKSDVFSFGILIWEIVTLGSTPYENLSSDQVLQKVKIGGRLEKPPHCKAELCDVMSKCWTQNPKDRPTFSELSIELEKLLLSENDYIELNQYPNHAYYNILTDKSDEKL